jgi:hypothetical protein
LSLKVRPGCVKENIGLTYFLPAFVLENAPQLQGIKNGRLKQEQTKKDGQCMCMAMR